MPVAVAVPVSLADLELFAVIYPVVIVAAGVVAALYLYNRFLFLEKTKA